MNANSNQPCPWIVTTTAESFERDVFQRSREVAVVVDFWAEWCAPCRALGPVLERLAEQYAGRFVLVKADTDRLPDAAMQFQVQSIPAVFGVVGGEVVDLFTGALPEAQITQWLDRLLQNARLVDAQQLEAQDPSQAEQIYRQILDERSNEPAALIGLGRALLAQQRVAEVEAIVTQLESRGFLEPEAEKLKSAVHLHGNSKLDTEALRTASAARPEDLELRLQLAQALAADGVYQEAFDICLTLIERDRHGVGEQARKTMVDVFRVMPEGSELVSDYRRRLAMLLY